LKKSDVIYVLEDIARLLILKDENPFKVRAYEKAARVLEQESRDIEELVERGELSALAGIGETLNEKITQLVKTGKLKFYEDLKAEIPEGLIQLNELPGIGPKKARHLFYDLGLQSIGELEYACQENRLLKLKSFGEKTQDNILKAIKFYKKSHKRFLIPVALAQAQEFVDYLKAKIPHLKIEIAGSLRRKKETIGDIDLVVATENPHKVMDAFVGYEQSAEILAHGDTKSALRLKSGIQVDIRCVSAVEYPFALHHLTGSKEHNVALRQQAQALGLKLNEYGLFKDEKLIPCKIEEEIYHVLGLSYVPPELREGLSEIKWAQEKQIPPLIELGDLQGTYHMHSNYSDGKSSVEDLVIEAKKMGLHYIGLSDHSQSAFYAHGLKAADIKKQHAEIDRLNKKYKPFKILKGIESDILADGSLDYTEDILKKFDFVIASVHSRFKMDQKEMTERLVKALQNPYTTMLGHMTGRLLLSREGYLLDVEKILKVAAQEGKIIELNASPYRLDI